MIVADAKRVHAHMHTLAQGAGVYVGECDFDDDLTVWMTVGPAVSITAPITTRDYPSDRLVYFLYDIFPGRWRRLSVTLEEFLSMTPTDIATIVDTVGLQRLEFDRLANEMSAFKHGAKTMMKSLVEGLLSQKGTA